MNSLSLRGVEDEVKKRIKQEAKTAGTSVNALILDYIHRGIGYDPARSREHHHDLDHLAGTWSEKDKKEFEDAIGSMDKIDEEMWT